VTRRTARQFGRGSQLVLRCKLPPHLFLVRGRLPVHVKNLIPRAKVLLRIPVALQAKIHVQGRCLQHQRHLVHAAVARRAADALVDMNAVIEINVVRQAMHFVPMNGFIRPVALAHRLQVAHVVEEHRVAIHAGFGGRNSSVGRGFDAGMAIPAVDAVVPDVVLVAELNRLSSRYVLIRDVGRSCKDQNRRQCNSPKYGYSEQAGPGDKVCTAVKDLCHVRVALERASSP